MWLGYDELITNYSGVLISGVTRLQEFLKGEYEILINTISRAIIYILFILSHRI